MARGLGGWTYTGTYAKTHSGKSQRKENPFLWLVGEFRGDSWQSSRRGRVGRPGGLAEGFDHLVDNRETLKIL